MRMLDLVLKYNIFEFDQKLFVQLIGTAMGTVCAPPYANIFMQKIDIMLKNLAKTVSDENEDPIRLYKVFWMTYLSFGKVLLKSYKLFCLK